MNHYNSYKKFKKKIILKYEKKKLKSKTDSNKSKKMSRSNNSIDKFISINEFLAGEMSKGPEEEKGIINYNYQAYTNIFNFFTILSNYYNFNEIICIPKFVLKFRQYIDMTSIIYFTDSKEFVIPVKLKENILKCSKKTIRFIYCTFMIDSLKNKGINHANILILDLYKKTLERFEPYGHSSHKYENEINLAIRERLMKIINLEDFTYLSPLDISPVIGPQSKADAYGGMCITFCMLYLQLRLMNPDTNQKELIEYLSNKNKHNLKKMILKYAKFVEITLKKYHHIPTHNEKYIIKKWNSLQNFIISGENNEKYVELGIKYK
jgi:hypothetical protein